MKQGVLNIVTTPIGNYADLTIRAYNALSNCDIIIAESVKESSRLLKFFGIDKESILLNEHNEEKDSEEIIKELLEGKEISLISDGGTPGFADPGSMLIKKCIDYNIRLNFIHGPNSVISAIVVSGFDISRFHFIGFLSPKREERTAQLKDLRKLDRAFVLMDTPYRLHQLLEDMKLFFSDRRIMIAFNMTMDGEKKFRGTINEIEKEISEFTGGSKLKGEFVIVVEKALKSKPE